MPVVSVIVPVFNLEDKIQRCIETLVNQTLKDIEIILVNDCSTDNTINILEDNKNKYNNIKVLNLGTNVRQGGARNRGLELSKGEYICFIDGDDYIELDMLEKLYDCALIGGYDIVDCNYFQEDEDGNIIERISIPNNIIKSNNTRLFIMNCGRVWTKIYKRSFLLENNIKFIENK